MQITLDISGAPRSSFEFIGCQPSAVQPARFFDGTNPFVDLHLDFPVRFGHYQAGVTPFMAALGQLQPRGSGSGDSFAMMQFHAQRMEQLNALHDRTGEVRSIINLYQGSDKRLFKKRVSGFLGVDQGPSLKPEDVNAALYGFLGFVFLPFVDFHGTKSLVQDFARLVGQLQGNSFGAFVGSLASSGFLVNLQRDCLNLYPQILDAEMPLRAALFLDLTEVAPGATIAARVSTDDFQTYKDLYKDIVEVFGRQLVLVAGINNVIYRNDHNRFQAVGGSALSSLDKFAAKPLSAKFKYLDDCWYPIDENAVDTGVRNSIAHNNVTYDDVTQVITYFPASAGLEQSQGDTMYFLHFMRLILLMFREMNDLHHLLKCLIYYHLLARH